MTSFTITINGQEVEARAGQTVLEAARAAGIDIPTLCHHPALKPIGACRVCLVEVSGQRALQPACTFPVAGKVEIKTESEKVVAARKFVLELIFSERNHFCMHCEMSGDCELQNLAYRYGMDHFIYPTYTQRFPVDASPEFFLLDHNRCVLCRRCIRACDELTANHTLDMSRRGAQSMVSADMNEPMGKASCLSCGTCLDVCPTGALVDKRSAFMMRKGAIEIVPSICTQCSLGCGIEIVVREGQVLRIRSRWDAPVNAGVLCKKGRFQSLSGDGPRIDRPTVRKNGRQVPATWEEALLAASGMIRGTDPAGFGVLASASATNEALHLVKELFGQTLGTRKLSVLGPSASHPVTPGCSLADVAESDCVLIIGADPAADQPVASFFVKRAVDRGARLILAEDDETALSAFADAVFNLHETGRAIEAAAGTKKPVVLYGDELPAEAFHELKKLNGTAKWLPLQSGVNAGTAADLGLNRSFNPSELDALYVIAGDQVPEPSPFSDPPQGKTRIIAQASYRSALTDRAEVVLPMAAWLERSGTFTNTFGLTQKARSAAHPKGQAKADWEILRMLGEKLGMRG